MVLHQVDWQQLTNVAKDWVKQWTKKTMRWLGAFLYAEQNRIVLPDIYSEGIHLGPAFKVYRNRIAASFKDTQTRQQLDCDDDPHHQACAIVEQILAAEVTSPISHMGGGDM